MITPTAPTVNLPNLALKLIQSGSLQHTEAEGILKKARKNNTSFYLAVVYSNNKDLRSITRIASEEFGVPLVELDAIDVSESPVDLVSEKLMRKHHVLPLHKRGTKLYLAVADPTNTRVLDEIKFHTGLGVEPILVNPLKLDTAIDKVTDEADTGLTDLSNEEDLDDIDISSEEEERGDGDDIEQIDTPIVRFVNKILLDAIKDGASDIHIEPYERSTRIRFRIDGVLNEITSPPLSLIGRIAARIKILSRLDIAERRVPQDGRMKLRLSKNKSIDFRVSTLPTLFGEKVVIRILDSTAAQLKLESLGFEPAQLQLYEEAVSRPYGMVLVTGPTGSGKTISLYSALNLLNTPEKNISTVEDPVEINMVGINQVNINEKANLTFASALRSFLRQDPDIIMVGEIRDLETADIAIKASQTGHLVLSTLHTNDAPATLTRLLNMGVAPFNIASSVNLIMAQRLVRRLCANCKQPVTIPEEALLESGFKNEELSELNIFSANGCHLCSDGYKGRLGVFQVMLVNDEMGDLIMQGCTQLDIEQLAAKSGVNDLRQSGLVKVKNGLTTLEEIERVTNN